MNAERKLQGLVEIGYGLGLHIGNVMFGNVGLDDRLAFSVFGAAVNEAARLETLTRTLEVPILASEEFRSRLTGDWVELGPQSVAGIAHPITVYTPCSGETCRTVPLVQRVRAVGHSNAPSRFEPGIASDAKKAPAVYARGGPAPGEARTDRALD